MLGCITVPLGLAFDVQYQTRFVLSRSLLTKMTFNVSSFVGIVQPLQNVVSFERFLYNFYKQRNIVK